MNPDSLITKHRPEKLARVIGHKSIVASFKAALDDRTSHAFLFTGPAGLGKTTLARLGAAYVGTPAANLIEVDAATYSRIDDMRTLTASLDFRPLGKDAVKSLIVDECQAISSQAWQSLLKRVEEPPAWVYWFFCTTEMQKVPANIRSRCSVYTLNPLPSNILFDYLEKVIDDERFDTPRAVIEVCVRNADGSPRKALSNLAVCYAARDRKEAAGLILDLESKEGGTPFTLAKALADGWTWKKVQPILSAIVAGESEEGNVTAETVRHVVLAYFTKMAASAKEDKNAAAALRIMDQFSDSWNPADGFSPLVMAVGRTVFMARE